MSADEAPLDLRVRAQS